MSGTELLTNRLWWNGPEFLLSPESEWPPCSTNSNVDESALEELVKRLPSIIHLLVITEERNAHEWTKDQQTAFEDLKMAITTTPVLIPYYPE